jgi:hypothetical protein
MSTTKKWYASKGIWIGVLTVLVGAAEALRQLVEFGDFSSLAVVTSILGIMKIVQRVASSGEEITL